MNIVGKLLDNAMKFIDNLSTEEFKELLDDMKINYIEKEDKDND